jgi:predicted PurR-regulated permease PerM
MPAPERVITVRPRTVLTVLALVLAVGLAIGLVVLAWQVITWILIALFLALALNPAVVFFERRGLGRAAASLLVLALAFCLIGAFAYLLVPPLVDQVGRFVDALPDIVGDITRGEGPLGFLETDYQITERVRQAVEEQGLGGILGFTDPALAIARSVFTAVVGTVTIVFLTAYMLIDGRRLVALALDLVPEGARWRWERVARGIYRTVGGYVTGNLLISVLAGGLSMVVLLAVGVPYVVPLGLLVGVLDLIPLVGATFAAVAVAAVAFTEGIVPGVVVVVFFVAYQQLENHFVQPMVYGRTVRISPLVVLIAVLIGAQLLGVIGALGAIPVAASLQVVIQELVAWRRERRGGAAAADAEPGGDPADGT